MSNEKRSSWKIFTWQRSKGDQTENGEISVVGVSQYAKPKWIREQPRLQSDGKLSKYEGGKNCIYTFLANDLFRFLPEGGGGGGIRDMADGQEDGVEKTSKNIAKPLIFWVPSHEYEYLSLNIIKNDFLICLSLSGRWDLGKNHPYVILANSVQLGEHQKERTTST